MSLEGPACYGYRVREVAGEWRWTAFDPAGRVRAEGRSPTRAAAAARVILALAAEAIGCPGGQAED